MPSLTSSRLSDFVRMEEYNASKALDFCQTSNNCLHQDFQHGVQSTYWPLVWVSSILYMVELPCVCFALYVLCLQRKSNQSSIFIINLLLTDLIQIVGLIIISLQSSMPVLTTVSYLVYRYALNCSTYFMGCIAMERYVSVSHPVWYRTQSSAKCLCCISVMGWFEPLIFWVLISMIEDLASQPLLVGVCYIIRYLIPFLLIIFSFVGMRRALSHSISIAPYKRRLIVGTLSLVLLNYSLILIPMLVIIGLVSIYYSPIWVKLFTFFAFVNPLADCLLYAFTRSETEDAIWTLPCCRCLDGGQQGDVSQDSEAHVKSSQTVISNAVTLCSTETHT